MIQSTPATVSQRRVVGPGGSTPHVSSTFAGSPHAPVAWASVHRRG